MEEYADFLTRTAYQQPKLLISPGYFTPDERIRHKVKPDKSFRPFFGDTTAFDLDSGIKERIAALQETLYERAPECFCARLEPETLHMTLHDLSSSFRMEKVASEVFYNEINLVLALREQPAAAQTIRMRSNYIFNCVNTSLVLALQPEDEEEWLKLQSIYDTVDKVQESPYPLTPHVTLAYFSYHGFSAAASEKLQAAVYELNQETFSVTLDTKELYYQKFTDMNSYFSVFPLTGPGIAGSPAADGI